MAKILVAYYSRSGNTKKVAEEIAGCLKADIDEIIDKKARSGPMVFLTGSRDAMKGYETEIETKNDPKEYSLIIVGTPIWAGTVTPAVRAYLKKSKPKKVAFFCSCGGSQVKAFEAMEKLSRKPVSTLEVKQADVKTEKMKQMVKRFCRALKK